MLHNHPRPSSYPPSDPLQTDRPTVRPTSSRLTVLPTPQTTDLQSDLQQTDQPSDRPTPQTDPNLLTNQLRPHCFQDNTQVFSEISEKTVFCFQQQHSFLFSTKQFSVFNKTVFCFQVKTGPTYRPPSDRPPDLPTPQTDLTDNTLDPLA